jgi:alkanesulfonate monooxygenase SsuD/methylene tetrahydromethanopterin reductase-like flavin-dependent oxidoreductase (luciferase family)
MHWDEVKDALYADAKDAQDFSYARVKRLLDFVRGEKATDFAGTQGFEVFSQRVQPYSPGLGGRMWYGGASLASAQWAGENAMNFLTSSVVSAEESENFDDIQLTHVRTFRAHHPDGEHARVCQGLVVIPTDTATSEQRMKYAEYAAKRLPRTATPQGPRRMMFSPDYVGTSDEVAERLYAQAAFQEIDEVAFALPFTFEHEDYVQILTDMATRLGPALGWRPTAPGEHQRLR